VTSGETSIGGTRRAFEPTKWTVVLKARDRKETGALVERYWKPCYFYIRRKGHGVEDAKDLTQGFFLDFIERDALAGVTRAKGRFRSFLLACLDHYLSNEYDRRRAKKRSAKLVPLDFDVAETQFRQCPHDSPERAFHRQWAHSVMDKGIARLHEEMGSRFDLLREYLITGEARLKDVAKKLDLSESNAKVILHRARKRYRELLRDEIARTVERPGEVDDEMKELFALLS
jgi:RNA polymerase sigma factor (sigma-70 family)